MTSDEWRPRSGIFILVNLPGELASRIHAIQEQFDPKLAHFAPPHFTLIGSSGAGPISADTSVEVLRDRLRPIAESTPPFVLQFARPVRYMNTNTFALPLDPHGPLRELHDRIRRSGLSFAASRHAFTPHVTLSHYRTLDDDDARRILAVRMDESFLVDRLHVSLTVEPSLPRPLFDLELSGGG